MPERRERPFYSRAGVVHGVRLALPLVPGVVVFAAAFGAAASQKGLSLWEAVAISAFVFAGASQMVALELWQEVWTVSALLQVMAVTALVNARLILLGAAVQPWMAGAPRSLNAASLFLFTDASYILSAPAREEGGRDIALLLGSGAALWIVWTLATIPGFLAGALVEEPRRYGLDLVLPIFFAALLVPLWRGWRAARPWAVAGAAAIIVQALVPGYFFILVGAVAGSVAGALARE
jgi:predicted branched-subunit amino acid permease